MVDLHLDDHDLLLVVGVVVADELAAEHQPVGEAVEGLVAVGDPGDLLPLSKLFSP
jgi:hypothetical protein